ncbi:MAG TPA: hypothetical protein VLG50_05815 [Candidatus Saccharimonadales bacterium]|nr:hypothetical protein [Candidatus Saccharimonadales bacterium]
MNNFKEPTSLVAGTNIIFTVGSFMYLYKRMEQMQKENDELKKNMQVLMTKLQKYTNDDVQTEEAIKTIDQNMKTIKQTYKDEIKAIKEALTDNDIDIRSPKMKKKSKKIESSGESSEETPKKKPKKKVKDDPLEDEGLIDLFRSKRGN